MNSIQKNTLLVIRILIGWHLLYEGIVKLISPGWSSAGFLSQSQWILSGFANWVISHDGVLRAVDFLNTWGLIAIGLGLILGLFTKPAAFSGTFLLLIYYLNNPPFIGMEVAVAEGSYLVVNKTLIEAVMLFFLALIRGTEQYGLDYVLHHIKNVKRP